MKVYDRPVTGDRTLLHPKYQKFVVNDSLETFLNIWIEYMKAENKSKWCKDYDIKYGFMKDINDKMDFIFHSLYFYDISRGKIDLTDAITSSYIKSLLINNRLVEEINNLKKIKI